MIESVLGRTETKEAEINCYNKAIDVDKNYILAYEMRGIHILSKKKQYPLLIREITQSLQKILIKSFNSILITPKLISTEEIQFYNKAIELNPKKAAAYMKRDYLQQIMGQINKALQDYNKIIELNPKFAVLYMYRVNLSYNKGDKEKALLDYERALSLKPNFLNAYINRANLYQKGRNVDNAWINYQKAILLNPNNPIVNQKRGQTFNLTKKEIYP